MTVEVQIACPEHTPQAEQLAGWARAARGDAAGAVCLRVVDATEGAALNGRYRQRDGATNVLAFPAGEQGVLGDIAICAPVAAQEARQQGKALADHYAHLVVHGVLHLLGMDHHSEPEAVRMEAKETELLRGFGIADPYVSHARPAASGGKPGGGGRTQP